MLTPGDVMNEKVGARHVMINTSNADATILAGVLLPKGAELTTVVAQQPVGMPSTGVSSIPGAILAVLLLSILSLVLGSAARFAQARNR